MARIKCRYRKYDCELRRCGCDTEFYETCFDVDETKRYGDCKHCEPTPNSEVINPPCCHISKTDCEFEKNFNTYEMSYSKEYYGLTGFLRVGKTYIDIDNIDYLEIDGRVLIGGGQDA